MRYSFIAPRPKPLFSLFTKIWLVFIGAVVAFMVLLNMFILYKTSSYKNEAQSLIDKRVELDSKIDKTDEEISFILRQKTVAEEIFATNIMLQESMKNLFDLVPDQITLNRVLMEKDSLVLYGVTPTKDAFNFLLEAPLKSIFHTSSTVFYLTKEGWYNFVSTNKIIASEGIRE
ncbi:MAG: hypothetical protein PHW07_01215 [Sulfurospirillaceae bacterium]|nr:hypothetical protein [Sulfurospirillaceae bacterium]